ncbi:MAG: ABC transporter ATP-binding protein [Hyphomicrobiaceae bacterium]
MNVRMLIGFAKPYRAPLALALGLMLASTAITLSIPWFGGVLAGDVLKSASANPTRIVLALLALLALLAAVNAALAIVTNRTEQRILADLSMRIYDHLQSLPLTFHYAHRHGDLLALLTFEAGQVSSYITGTLLSALPLFLTIAGAYLMLIRIDPVLAIAVAFLMPALIIALKLIGRRMRPISAQLQDAYAQATATAEENLSMLAAIKAFAREKSESERYNRQVRNVEKLAIKQQQLYALLEPATHFATSCAVVLIVWFASSRIQQGNLSPSELVTFLLYAAAAARPLSGLASLYGQTQRTRGTLQRLEHILAQIPESGPRRKTDLATPAGAISLKDVSFAYPGRANALTGISLDIAPGETIALTGHNGSGKTTLVHLIMGFFQPQFGTISIDGTDTSTVSLHSLRSAIGLVPQQLQLFNASVRDNIAFGRVDASTHEIEAAARSAQAHDFIHALPQGYDTIIGDRGVRLSGGQRQRIALARALIKNPPILILDEATAMFDPDGEVSFIQQAHDVLSQRTVILITHRPASLALANRIVTMDNGQIISVCEHD